MLTKSKTGNSRPKHRFDPATISTSGSHSALLSYIVPKGFKTTFKDPHWVNTMLDEIKDLRENASWVLVPWPVGSNVLGYKWNFRVKFKPDHSLERFKARVVVQGFGQIPGFDYTYTFSPVVKASTIWVVLSIAITKNWPLHQLDIKTHYTIVIFPTIFIEQPPVFVDACFPHHVYRFKKPSIDLRRPPRTWFQRLSTFLVQQGFTCSRSDTALYLFLKGSYLSVFLCT